MRYLNNKGNQVNLLQPILKSHPPLFSLATGLLLSTLLATASFADNASPLTSNNHTAKKITPSITSIAPIVFPLQPSQMPAPRYYYSPQQQQYYQAIPYPSYYPQQHPATYYYPYATQRNAYNFPQTHSYPNHPTVNTTSNNNTARYPMRKKIKKKKHAWGDQRHIWPDFYTGFTNDAWDKMINAPYDAGRMPGGWRAPSLSTPDPVTVTDAVANQMPPIMEEMGNMTNFSN